MSRLEVVSAGRSGCFLRRLVRDAGRIDLAGLPGCGFGVAGAALGSASARTVASVIVWETESPARSGHAELGNSARVVAVEAEIAGRLDRRPRPLGLVGGGLRARLLSNPSTAGGSTGGGARYPGSGGARSAISAARRAASVGFVVGAVRAGASHPPSRLATRGLSPTPSTIRVGWWTTESAKRAKPDRCDWTSASASSPSAPHARSAGSSALDESLTTGCRP